MERDLVSVVMATYNEPSQYISIAISSILNQTYRYLELLIADDSTRQETIDVINHYADKDSRIKIIRKKEKMGFVPALNYALREAKGEFIARMDGDDQALPERLSLEVAYLKQRPEVSVVGGQMNIMNTEGVITSQRRYPLQGKSLLRWYIYRNPLAHPTVMFRASNLQEGFYYDERFKKSEDIELWGRYLSKGKAIHNIPETVLNFRVVPNMGQKRNHTHFLYNFKARIRSVRVNRFFPYALGSVMVSLIYVCIPKLIWNLIYRIENK